LGINGAAIASTIAYTFSAITGIFIFRKISGISLREFLIITRKDIYKYPSLYRKLIRQSKRA
jgi:Na+-driven multidrug efflux pump